MSDNITYVCRTEMEVYFFEVLILYAKWHNELEGRE